MINIRRRVTGEGSSGRPGWLAVSSATTALLLAASLAACGGGSGDGNDGDSGTVTLTWYASSIDQNQLDYRQLLVKEFQDAYPTIKINLVSPQVDNTDAIRAELRELLPGDAAPDVYLGDVIWPAEFAEAGLARPLDEDFDDAFWERFPSELSSPMRYQDKTYAVPFFANQAVLYYRTDLMPEGPPTTWEGLVVKANSLLQEGKVEHGFAWQGAAYEGLTCNWLEYLTDAGGRIMNEESTEALLDSPAAHRALQFMVDLTAVSHPQVDQFEEFDATEAFSAGQVAFLRGWNTSYTRMNVPDNPRVYGNIGVVELPTFADRPGRGYSTTGGWNLYVNPSTSHLAAAETFIDWLTGDQAQLIIAGYSHLPANADVRAQLASGDGNPAVVTGLAAQPVARPASRPDYPEISRIVYTAVNDVLDHDPPVDVALRRADDQLDELLR